MFDNVSRATELANEIRETWGHWQRLEALRDGYRANLDHRSGMITQHSMDGLQELINEYQVKWQAETGKPWRVDYYHLTPADDVMGAAFAALADELEAQDAELLQEAVDVLTVWDYIKEHGGGMGMYGRPLDTETQIVTLWNGNKPPYGLHEAGGLKKGAGWVRKLRGDK